MDKINYKQSAARFLSAFLAVLMVVGVIGSLSILPVYATAAAAAAEKTIDYLTYDFKTAEEKLETMELRAEDYGYQLYFETHSGEIALRNVKTGQIMFSNPYSVGTAKASNDIKNQLLSQVVVTFMDNDQEKNYYSYTEAAVRNQILGKNLKSGLRVEYTIGKEETRNLVPMRMEANRFQELILDYVDDEQATKKLKAFYTLKDPEDPRLTVRGVKELQATFPITTRMAVYVFDPYASAREITLIESYIKRFCPHYTFAELDSDHSMTEYEGATRAPALFKLSLEYYLNEDGLQVRLPANGIRFDESTYKLEYIQILPYMGAGSYENAGYTFIPDGSGAIIRFEDFIGKPVTIAGKIYGQDYAYYVLSGAHQEVMRLPVYGVVENYHTKYEYEEETTVEKEVDGKMVSEVTKEKKTNEIEEDRGFVAIVTEGDALAQIKTSHGGTLHRYCTVYTQFNPRPKDSYNLAEAISVGANATWTVVSKRKYTGSYRIQYIMLTDETLAKTKNIKDYYEVSWVGMAKAYRDYLQKNGILTPIQETKPDIPLYIESFGAVDTQEMILTFPVMTKTPLTTFEDVKTMYEELAKANITNIHWKLLGFANGGLWVHYPTKVKFEKKVGGNNGYKDLLAYAKNKGFDVYPDFNFVYQDMYDMGDGFNIRTDAVKAIDGRWMAKRLYNPVFQEYRRGGWLTVVAPSVYMKLYGKFQKYINKLGVDGLSLSVLGADLSSDFDKKDPYNREDSKEQTAELLETMYNDYGKLMMDAGNVYALPYASHLLNVALDSSRYFYSSQTVPFTGMVLHGYIPFAGAPTNMAGDIFYEILKIIENGSSPYFTLSYRNTAKLKDLMDFAHYYSIRYDIWYDDLIVKYNTINDALKDVQKAFIDDHKFITDAERIPTDAEVAEDKAEIAALAAAEAKAEALKLEKAEKKKLLEDRKAAEALAELLASGGEAPRQAAEAEEAKDKTELEKEDKKDTAAKVTGYVPNKYTCAIGTVVKVTYSNGTSFILNYNSYPVKAEGKTIEALSFVKIG